MMNTPCRDEAPAVLEQLVEKWQKYVRTVAREFFNNNTDLCRKLGLSEEDLFQVGMTKICSLVSGYDPDRGIQFETYCKLPLVNAMTDTLRLMVKAQKYDLENRDYSWDPETEEAAELVQFHYLEPEPAYLRKETLEELRAALARLPARDLAYLIYRFGMDDGEERKPSDAAKHFGLGPASQKRAEQEALCHIRQQMP